MAAPTTPTVNASNQEFEEFKSKLSEVKQHGGYFTALCPAHNDHNPSLSFRPGDKRPIVATCHRGCRFDEIYEAAMGRPLAPDRPSPSEVETVYVYRDAQGEPLYEKVRLPGKKFHYQRFDHSAGEWKRNLDGVDRVLYRLPEVLEAVNQGETVYIVEGEKDADTLARLGFPATTSPNGADDWRPEYSQWLRGADVVVIPDHDKAGQRHAKAVESALDGVANSVVVVDLPGLDDGEDVSDWFARGGTKDDLLRLVSPARTNAGRRLLTLDDLESFPPLEFLVDGYVQERGLNLMFGPSGHGKTFVSLDIALSVATGQPWQGQQTREGRVLLVVGEGQWGLANRIEAWQAGNQRVPRDMVRVVVDPLSLLNGDDVGWLIRQIQQFQPSLVVLDPLARFMDGADENRFEDMGKVLASLDLLLVETGTTLLVVHHSGKDPSRGERGHSSLRAGVDIALKLRSDTSGTIRVQVDKARDLASGHGIFLRLVSAAESAYLAKADSSSSAKTLLVLKALKDLGEEGATATKWQKAADEAGVSSSTFYHVLTRLVDGGFVDGGGRNKPYTLTAKGREAMKEYLE